MLNDSWAGQNPTRAVVPIEEDYIYGTIFEKKVIEHSSSSIGTTTLSLVSACWAFSSGRFYRVSLPVARQTPNLEENEPFRAFQLSPQEAPSVWSDASEPNSGRWIYGREMAETFSRKWQLPPHFWVLLHAVKHDMGQTALLPLRRKACWGFFRPKNPTASAGFESANLGTKGQQATSRPPKPLYWTLNACFYFTYKFVSHISHSKKNWARYDKKIFVQNVVQF
jgi:hypothetical protein